jgi:hypothetical protein
MTLEDESRKLGSVGRTIFLLALGCMGMSGVYGQTDDNESIARLKTLDSERGAGSSH